jgi:1-acyl-sn-glycerol-3-phosphate acyltransferase
VPETDSKPEKESPGGRTSATTPAKPKVDHPVYLWYGFSIWVTRFIAFAQLGGMEFYGRSKVPMKGPVIIACNHLSQLDPPAVACATKRHVRFMAKQELFKGFFAKMIYSMGAYPVKRGTSDTEAIRKTLDILESGQALLLFPEGTRGDGKHLGPMGRGAALLAKRSGAWIVPTAINGTQFMLPRGAKRIRRGRVKVAFGTPFRYSDCGDDREAFIARLESEIIELAGSIGLKLLPAESKDSETSS